MAVDPRSTGRRDGEVRGLACSGLLRRGAVVGVICGFEGFGFGALEIEEDYFIRTGMEPRTGSVERELRTDGPETAEGLMVQEGDALREAVGIEKCVGEDDGESAW